MKDKTLTDVMLICKGWYNKEKYHSVLEALNGYYHKYYGCEDVTMDEEFALNLFLQPLVLETINRRPRMAYYLFEPHPCQMNEKHKEFCKVMYDRCLNLIRYINKDTFDLSDYQDMFDKARKYNYEDNTIGVI